MFPTVSRSIGSATEAPAYVR